MLTFKQFLNEDIGSSSIPPQAPAQQPQHHLKGALTANQQRVLALLSTNALKTAPGLARTTLTGDQNLVQAIKELKLKFKAVDVMPDGVVINQTGNSLAGTHGIIDPNSGALTALGKKLASTKTDGSINPKTQGVLDDQQPQGAMPQAGGQGAPQAPAI